MEKLITKLKRVDRNYWILGIFFLVFVLFFLTPWIHGNDGVGYYSYVRSAFIDHDLDFKNELDHYSASWKINSIRQDDNTGKYFSQYPIGTALFWSPFFLGGHLIASVTSYANDGYSLPYVYLVCLGSAIYGFIGLCLLYSILKKYFKKMYALIALLAIWLSSNLFYYMFFESSLSHSISFFLASLIILVWERSLRKRKIGEYLFLGFLCGLAVLVRYQNIIFTSLLMIELFPLLLYGKMEKAVDFTKKSFSSLIAFFIVLIPQILLLMNKHGSFGVSYDGFLIF